jgi:chorismate mutase/prephenate dehydrogenase
MEKDLGELREEISRVDRTLLELLRRRLELSAVVGRLKAAEGLPVVVRDAEDRVLARARGHAEACGISEEAMEGIFHAILRGSVERQHRVGLEERTRRGERVLVIGGAGGMGSWFRGFLIANGHSVAACDPVWKGLPGGDDRHADLDEIEDLDVFDAILVSVPLRRTAGVLESLTGRRPRGLVLEISSIKSHLEPVLRAAEQAGVRVAALHPMFGPAKAHYEPLTFVLACRRSVEEDQAAVTPLLRHPYTRIVSLPFEHHDRLMGWLLGLAHFTGLLFGSALAASGLEPSELRACASTTFLRQAATARSVLAEDPDLYLDIQRLNPHREEVYAAARTAMERLVRLVEAEDREGFRDLMRSAGRAVTGVSQ